MNSKEHITLVGAGLSGPVMATYLSSLGFSINVYEARSDMRKISTSAGRSINLALSARGIRALKDIGVFKKIEPDLIPMSGRMIHDANGNIIFSRMVKKEMKLFFSVSRSNLNKN